MAETHYQTSEEQLDIFSQFAIDLVNIIDKDQLLWLVAREVVSKLGFVDCVIYEILQESGRLTQKAAYGIKNPYQEVIINHLEIPIGKGVTGTVAQSGEATIIADSSLDQNYIMDVESNFSEITVPIIYNKRVYGVIDCEDPRRDYFGQAHLRALETIAAMVSSKLLQFEMNTQLKDTNRALNEEIGKGKLIESKLKNHRDLLELEVERRTSDLQSWNDELIKEINNKLHAEAQMRSNEELLHQSAKMASIGILAAGMAHEINNPIAFVNSNLQSIEEMLEDLESTNDYHPSNNRREALDSIDKEVLVKKNKLAEFVQELPAMVKSALDGTSRVIQIVSELTEYCHQDAEGRAIQNINLLTDKAISLATNELKYKAHVNRYYSDLSMVYCWGDKLVQVFLNLIVNAAQAIDDFGEINISTSQMNDSVIIRICDNGNGMSDETKEKIFDPFFTTKEVGIGTGLGMHISYNIVKNHNGKIRVRSELGKGTEISISIPVEKENFS